MPKFKNPLAAAAALAEKLSNPSAVPRRAPAPPPRTDAPEATERDVAASAEPSAPPATPSTPSTPSTPATPAGEGGRRRPYVLQEVVIPLAEEEKPPEVTFSSFQEEGEGDGAVAEAEGAAGEDSAPPARRRRSAGGSELASNVWAAAILLGVACTVLSFFVGALR